MNYEEELLQAWLEMSACIRGNRFLKELSLNEIMIYNYLYQSRTPMTATDLCQKTHLLKSQINKILNAMESKKMIIRERSSEDKRKILIKLNDGYIDEYLKEHRRVLQVLSVIRTEMGENDVALLTFLMHKAVTIFENQTVQGDNI